MAILHLIMVMAKVDFHTLDFFLSSGREEREGSWEGEDLCSFSGLPVIGWVIITFLGYCLPGMGVIIQMKALSTEPELY